MVLEDTLLTLDFFYELASQSTYRSQSVPGCSIVLEGSVEKIYADFNMRHCAGLKSALRMV